MHSCTQVTVEHTRHIYHNYRGYNTLASRGICVQTNTFFEREPGSFKFRDLCNYFISHKI